MMLSLRNTFRRRIRLALFVTILAIGGATFISSVNVNQSWLQTIDVAFRQRHYDFKIDFAQPYATVQVEETLQALSDVVAVESWNSAIAVEERPDDTNALVINHEMLYDDHSDIQLDDTIVLAINGKPETWRVVGVVREVGSPRRGLGIPASAYVSLDYFNQITGMADSTVSTEHFIFWNGPK